MSNSIKAEVYVIKERCKGCGICIEVCQARVLERSTETNSGGYYIPAVKDADACLGCGMCEMLCPDFAVWVRVIETEEISP
jgi:2-oxoglutarate ferredoxin oxidoreductase subunit delta